MGGAGKSSEDPELKCVVLRSFLSAALHTTGARAWEVTFPEQLMGQQQMQDQNMWF